MLSNNGKRKSSIHSSASGIQAKYSPHKTNAKLSSSTNNNNRGKKNDRNTILTDDELQQQNSNQQQEQISAWDKHNLFVKALLLFMFKIVSLGHRNKLHLKDIRVPPKVDRSKKLADKLKQSYELELLKEKPSLSLALMRTFWPNVAISFFFDVIAKCLLAPMQIIALGWIIRDSHLLARHYELTGKHANNFLATNSNGPAIATTTTINSAATTLAPSSQFNSAKDFFGDLMKISEQERNLEIQRYGLIFDQLHEQIVIDAILLICLAFFVNFFDHLYFLSNARADMKYRIACGKLVYEKALRLSKVSLAGTTAGQMVNLLSNDVNRFEESTKTLSNLITAPAQTIIVLIILPLNYLNLNSTLAGLATVIFYMITQTGIGRAFSRLRLLTARRTDRRVLLINEIIVAIRVIKMYAWEEPFKRLVQIARRRELNMIGLTFILRATNHTLFLIASKIVVFALLITYVFTGHSLNGEVVFVTLGMGNLIRTSLTFHFPNAIAVFAGAIISCRRLNEFLLLPEVDHPDDESNYRIIPMTQPLQTSSDLNSFNQRSSSHHLLNLPTITTTSPSNTPASMTIPTAIATTTITTTTSSSSSTSTSAAAATSTATAAATSSSQQESLSPSTGGATQSSPPVILFNRVKASWSLMSCGQKNSSQFRPQVARNSLIGNKHFSLPSLSLSVKARDLIMVIGRVGSGKSSLLLTILGELPIQSGRLQIKGKLAYAPQEAWIFPGTVRENILLGKAFKRDRYLEVIQVCSLKRDLDILIEGDATYVGDRGVSLSGGQRARINLARALYHEADIYVLDDPLSAVDAPVARHIFTHAIRTFLRGKTVILATHQLQFLRFADKVLVLERDQSPLFGTVEQLRQSDKFKALNFAREAFEEAHREGVDCREQQAQAAAATAAAKAAAAASAEAAEQEVDSIATASSDTKPFVTEESGELEIPTPSQGKKMTMMSLVAQPAPIKKTSIAMLPENVKTKAAAANSAAGKSGNSAKMNGGRIETESSDTLSSNWSAYVYYVQNSANWIAIIWFIVVNIIAQVNLQYVDYFLSLWTHSIQRHEFEGNSFQPASYIDNLDNNQIAIWYAAVIGLCLVVSYIRTGTFYLGALCGSSNIHKKLFNSFIRAPVSFYDFKPIGILLNRVSRDIGYVDEMLPNMMLETISSLFFFCGILGVTIFIDPRNAIGSILLIIMALMVRYFMARTIIRLKQLEGIARSPVFSHLSVSLNGLSVIRVFKIEHQFCQKFDSNQDDHSGVWFYYTCASRFLSLSIDMFTFMFIASIIYTQIFVWFDPLNASFIGLTLTQIINLPLPVRRCMKTLIELDSYMTSVQRIKEFSDVDNEDHQQQLMIKNETKLMNKMKKNQQQKQQNNSNQKQAKAKTNANSNDIVSIFGSYNNKPIQRGRIKFHQVTLKYLPNEPAVLRSISFSIEPAENIGIVGRTGAGKSSIMAALFRLYPFDGLIEIDGHDVKQMSLRQLRSSISIIPQEPILFGGSLRKNLDPFGEHSDFELWASLEAVRLDNIFSSSAHGLEFEIQEFGANLSVGQRQLICLSRAILRRNKILVLDEATANVDQETDYFIQQTIRQQFAGCTVLTIAHRLLTIVNSDRVLVLDAGQVREFDEPYALLQQPESLFHEIVNGAQAQHRHKIINLIKEAHDRRNKSLTHRF